MNGVPICISGAASCPGYGVSTPLDYLNAYCPNSWAFPSVVPAGYEFWATDFWFQSKDVQPSVYGLTRNSYFILYGLGSVTDSMGGQMHLITPIICSAGFRITGVFSNQSVETQNMLGIVTGLLVPTSAPKLGDTFMDLALRRGTLAVDHCNEWKRDRGPIASRGDDLYWKDWDEPIPQRRSLWQRLVRGWRGR